MSPPASAHKESGNREGISGDHNPPLSDFTPNDLLLEMEDTWSILRQAHNRRLPHNPISGRRSTCPTCKLDGCECQCTQRGATTAQDVLNVMETSVPPLWNAFTHEQAVATHLWHDSRDDAGIPYLIPSLSKIDSAERSWERLGQCLSLLNTQVATQNHRELAKELEDELGADSDSGEDSEGPPPLMELEAESDWELLASPDPEASSTGRLGDLD
ncbi:hypothetical protein B0H12DRAFT_1076397 [Mycena haematopus]|nr:hypothetical protein B0H12DRAFT_1076397 [Mycena haematopus]